MMGICVVVFLFFLGGGGQMLHQSPLCNGPVIIQNLFHVDNKLMN